MKIHRILLALALIIGMMAGGSGVYVATRDSDTRYVEYHGDEFTTSVPAWDITMYRGESRTTSFFMLPEDTNRLVIETQGYFGSCDEMPTLAESAQVQIDRLSREGFTIEYINDAQEVSDVPAIEIQAGRLTEIPGAFRENGRDWNGMYHSTLMFFQNNCTTWQVFGGADEDHVEEVKSVYDKMLEDLYFNVRTTGG